MNSSATLGPESKDGKVTGIDAGDKKPEGKPAAQEIQTSESKEPGFLDTIVGFFKLKEEKAPESTEVKPDEKKLPEIVREIDKAEFRSSTWFSDYEAMKKNVIYYNEIHPFIYLMKGGLTNTGELSSSWSKTSRHARVAELRSLNPSVKIIPTIFRWENPKEKISENIGMNGRSDIRDKHIKNIIEEVETYGYDGIDIDYEGMT